MKATNIIQLLILMCSLTILVSCSDSWPYSEDAYNNTRINVYPSKITMNEDEFSGNFTVNSSQSWYVYDSPSWINLSRRSGYGYDNVSFTVDENEGSSDRYGYIKIRTNEGYTKETEVVVSQSPTVQFVASMSTTSYSAYGEWKYLSIKATSSKSWTISKSDYWVHLDNSYNSSYSYSGSGTKDVKIYVDANTSSYSRSSTLTIKCGTKTNYITISQDGKSGTAPFTITSVEVANTTSSGSIINDFGSKIYSYQTKYLTPKIYISVNTSGTYTVYTKLYNPDGTLSTGTGSPTGYSFSNTVTLYSYTTWYRLSGWGRDTAGNWSSGLYRWEFWYNGTKIGVKYFTIY